MLTLSDTAATEIRNLVAQPEVPADGGVRIASAPDGALTLALAGGPADGDAVVENGGARVFVEPEAGGTARRPAARCGRGRRGPGAVQPRPAGLIRRRLSRARPAR